MRGSTVSFMIMNSNYTNFCRPSGLFILLGISVALQIVTPDPLLAADAFPVSDGVISQMVREYTADLRTTEHRFRVPLDDQAFQIRSRLQGDWLDRLQQMDFRQLSRPDQIDYLLLKGKLKYSMVKESKDYQRDQAAATRWLPFWKALFVNLKQREDVDPIDPSSLAGQFDAVAAEVEKLANLPRETGEYSMETRLDALRAVELLRSIVQSLDEADRFYRGYDPSYNWWCRQPVDRLKAALGAYRTALQDQVVGVPESDRETIIGLPLGAEGISLELQHEWIAHSPDELIRLAEREMQWCERQMEAAATALGFAGDWRKALDHVKSKHVLPGDQPRLIRGLAEEAIQFLEDRQLLTIPPLAANGWRMTMMSPERQRVSPYFLGGDTIIVSYPTDAMTHEEKLMSMRSNNEHFARATVHHELIPGHHLQYHMLARHRPYRQLFATPFWMEGWALHWEMLLWDLDFARGPEDQVGMLFWRKHRCARIIFSLNYHLGTMTPQECVDYLINQVGHEPSAAAAEVRRSVMGNYGPMYQAAYMVGGLQLRKLHQEITGSGKMTHQQFHDAVLKEHSIPIELLRAFLLETELDENASPSWKFADQ
jgi:uncharacterized protein (DUF885 family)